MTRSMKLSALSLLLSLSVACGVVGSDHGGRTSGLSPIGTTCALDSDCTSGACSDGVCCNSACGASDPADCQACSAALTGQPDGTCAPVKRYHVSPYTGGTTDYDCRPIANSMGARPPGVHIPTIHDQGGAALPGDAPCDSAEWCDGVHTSCPGDGKVPVNTVVCRAPTGDCDPAEYCDGVSNACPPDAALPDGASCRPSNVCQLAGTCAAHACVSPGNQPSGTVCGQAANDCFQASVCNGGGSCSTVPAVVGKACNRNPTGIPDCGYCDGTGNCKGMGMVGSNFRCQ